MAMINCPECGNLVSDKAKACIHCGFSFIKEKNILQIKTQADKEAMVVVTYTFTDKKTGKVLGQLHQNQSIEIELDYPTTVVCHLGRGWKDCELEYTPNGIQRYAIYTINGCFRAEMSFNKVDVIDSD